MIKRRQDGLIDPDTCRCCAAPTVSRPWCVTADVAVASSESGRCDGQQGDQHAALHATVILIRQTVVSWGTIRQEQRTPIPALLPTNLTARRNRSGVEDEMTRVAGPLLIRSYLEAAATAGLWLASERRRIASRSFPGSPCPCRSSGPYRHCWRSCTPIDPCKNSHPSSGSCFRWHRRCC